jgi:SAM-dependent methyltransferase
MKCDVCEGEILDIPLYESVSDRRRGLEGSWKILECRHCGVLALHPRPGEEELRSYYSDYGEDVAAISFKSAGSRFPGLRKLFHLLSGDIDPRDFVHVSPDSMILDYGCGNATYLSYFRDQGAHVSGTEVSLNAVRASIARGLDVHYIEHFDQLPFARETFDIVYLMQVFEHLRDPHAALREIHRVLKPGGLLYIAVPNALSFWRNVFGRAWVSGWFAPFHLFHYGTRTLSQLAAKHGLRTAASWSRTPESWFRLNLKAMLWPSNNRLDRERVWIDLPGIRHLIMLFLRMIELLEKHA